MAIEKDTEKQKKVDDIAKEAEEISCPAQRALYLITEFLDGPMCGRCFPCSMGTYEAKVRLKDITVGKGKTEDLAVLNNIADVMVEISMCKKGKDTAKYLKEALEAQGFKEHLEGLCPVKSCIPLIEYRIIPEICINCGECTDACKDNAILGEKRHGMKRGYKPFEIRQVRCTKCGECVKVCPVDAIEVVNIEKEEPVKV